MDFKPTHRITFMPANGGEPTTWTVGLTAEGPAYTKSEAEKWEHASWTYDSADGWLCLGQVTPGGQNGTVEVEEVCLNRATESVCGQALDADARTLAIDTEAGEVVCAGCQSLHAADAPAEGASNPESRLEAALLEGNWRSGDELYVGVIEGDELCVRRLAAQRPDQQRIPRSSLSGWWIAPLRLDAEDGVQVGWLLGNYHSRRFVGLSEADGRLLTEVERRGTPSGASSHLDPLQRGVPENG